MQGCGDFLLWYNEEKGGDCTISFNDITKLFSHNLEEKFCIEIEFLVRGDSTYQSCWMGKMLDKANKEKEVYWYGLVPDGSQAYDYDNFRNFSSASVFHRKSLEEIWEKVEILTIDGCDPEERLLAYRS